MDQNLIPAQPVQLAQPQQNVGYGDFLLEIKTQIRQRQHRAFRAANKEMIDLYWWIGENINRKQIELSWGKAVVESLADDLQIEFPGQRGYSARNLWNMRNFYRLYEGKPKLQLLTAEIGWTSNVLVMSHCADDLEREFYLRGVARFGWTNKLLQHQLDNKTYIQYIKGETNFDAALPDTIKAQAVLAVKDHYTFDFLGLADQHSERELEGALVKNLRGFLAEMGGHFTFVGNQYRLEVDGKDYFIDLLLFHRRLRCLVAIELKIGEFKPEHKGQIEFYLDTLDQQNRLEGENPPIGIVICRSKTKTMVEYALRTMTRPLGIATYTVSPQLPDSFKGELPSPEQIAKQLESWQATEEEYTS